MSIKLLNSTFTRFLLWLSACLLMSSCFATYNNPYYDPKNSDDSKYGEGFSFNQKFYGDSKSTENSSNWYYQFYQQNSNDKYQDNFPTTLPSGYDSYNTRRTDDGNYYHHEPSRRSHGGWYSDFGHNQSHLYYKVPVRDIVYDNSNEALYIPIPAYQSGPGLEGGDIMSK